MSILAVVPAAGRGSRFGTDPKLAAPIGGAPMLERTVRSLAAAGVDCIVVVLAPGSALAALDVLRQSGVETTINPDPERGMFSSIQAGLSRGAARGGSRVEILLVLPADMPFIRPGTIRAVIDECRALGRVVCPAHDRRRGHPVAIPADLVPVLLAADPARSLSAALDEADVPRSEIDVADPGVLRDVDTPRDL